MDNLSEEDRTLLKKFQEITTHVYQSSLMGRRKECIPYYRLWDDSSMKTTLVASKGLPGDTKILEDK
jgi:hypothetical protein